MGDFGKIFAILIILFIAYMVMRHWFSLES